MVLLGEHHTEETRRKMSRAAKLRPRRRRISAEEYRRRQAYGAHRAGAAIRGIQFLLTYQEWLDIWISSGRFYERGRRVGQYVMARFGDVGPYSVDNVKIITSSENSKEKKLSEEGRLAIVESNKKLKTGFKHSQETKDRISATVSKVERTPEWCAKIAAKSRQQRHSSETKKKISDNKLKVWDDLHKGVDRKLWKVFIDFRASAKYPGVEFLLTYDEWLSVWENSGHLHERGRGLGQYKMVRIDKKGSFSVKNLIITQNTRSSKS